MPTILLLILVIGILGAGVYIMHNNFSEGFWFRPTTDTESDVSYFTKTVSATGVMALGFTLYHNIRAYIEERSVLKKRCDDAIDSLALDIASLINHLVTLHEAGLQKIDDERFSVGSLSLGALRNKNKQIGDQLVKLGNPDDLIKKWIAAGDDWSAACLADRLLSSELNEESEINERELERKFWQEIKHDHVDKALYNSVDAMLDRRFDKNLHDLNMGIDQLRSDSQALHAGVEVLAEGVAELRQTRERIEESLMRTETSLTRTEAILTTTRQEMTELRQGVAEVGHGVAELRQGLAETNQIATQALQSARTTRQELAELTQEIAEVGRGVVELRQGVAETNQIATQALQSARTTRQELAELTQEVAEVRHGVAEVRHDMVALRQSVAEVSQRVTQVTENRMTAFTGGVHSVFDQLFEAFYTRVTDRFFRRTLAENLPRELSWTSVVRSQSIRHTADNRTSTQRLILHEQDEVGPRKDDNRDFPRSRRG